MIWNRHLYEERHYVQFKDMLEDLSNGSMGETQSESTPYTYFTAQELDDLLEDMIENYQGNLQDFPSDKFSFITISGQSFIFDSDAKRLMVFVASRYWNHYIGYIEELTQTKLHILSLEVLAKFLNILEFTFPKYKELLNVYTSAKSHLMDKIQSSATGEARFNDTPQEEGTFSSDEHTTNLTQTKGTSETDGATKIARLNEINRLYNKVLRDWTNEFDELFIEEGNI